MPKDIAGRPSIEHCEDDPAGGSWRDAIAHIPKEGNKHESCHARMAALQRRLARGEQVRNREHFRVEGALPNGQHFYAFKVGAIRAYGWFSSKCKGVFFISHYTFKARQKLDPADTEKVIANWRKLEEQ